MASHVIQPVPSQYGFGQRCGGCSGMAVRQAANLIERHARSQRCRARHVSHDLPHDQRGSAFSACTPVALVQIDLRRKSLPILRTLGSERGYGASSNYGSQDAYLRARRPRSNRWYSWTSCIEPCSRRVTVDTADTSGVRCLGECTCSPVFSGDPLDTRPGEAVAPCDSRHEGCFLAVLLLRGA